MRNLPKHHQPFHAQSTQTKSTAHMQSTQTKRVNNLHTHRGRKCIAHSRPHSLKQIVCMQTGIEMMPFCFKASYSFGVTVAEPWPLPPGLFPPGLPEPPFFFPPFFAFGTSDSATSTNFFLRTTFTQTSFARPSIVSR